MSGDQNCIGAQAVAAGVSPLVTGGSDHWFLTVIWNSPGLHSTILLMKTPKIGERRIKKKISGVGKMALVPLK